MKKILGRQGESAVAAAPLGLLDLPIWPRCAASCGQLRARPAAGSGPKQRRLLGLPTWRPPKIPSTCSVVQDFFLWLCLDFQNLI